MINIVGLGCISSLGEGVSTFNYFFDECIPQPDLSFDELALSQTCFYQGMLENDVACSAYSLAIQASKEAMFDYRAHSHSMTKNIAVVVATGAGNTANIEMPDNGTSGTYDIAEQLITELGLSGVYCTVSNACSSSAYAMNMAEELLDIGHDAVLLCGVEAKSATSQATFKALMVLDPDSCRPFEESRKGTVFGCGAAALVLTKMGKYNSDDRVYATVRSVALNADAYHPTSPEPSGEQMRLCMLNAIMGAELNVEDIDYFVPHATGTRLNDDIERQLLSELCPSTFKSDKTLLLKKYIGHTGGASAAFSYLVAALLLWRFKQEKPTGDQHHVLVNATAFGGNNSSSVVSTAVKDLSRSELLL